MALVVNDAMTHVFFDALPFGGAGASGMGNYGAECGFQVLSHANAWYGKARARYTPDCAV